MAGKLPRRPTRRAASGSPPSPLGGFPFAGASPQEQMQFQFQQQLELQQQQFALSTGTGGGGLSTATSSAGASAMAFSPLEVAMVSSSPSLLMDTASVGMAPYFQRDRPAMVQPRMMPATSSVSSPPSSLMMPLGTLPSVTATSPPPPQLYKTSKMRRPELWQFIRLVVPDPPEIAAGKTYTNQDAREAYCLKCKLLMHYNTGSSNNVSRHMTKYHPLDLANYAQKVAEKKRKLSAMNNNVGNALNNSSSSSNNNNRMTAGRHDAGFGKRKLRPSPSNNVQTRQLPLQARPGIGRVYTTHGGNSSSSDNDLSDDLRHSKGKRKLRRTGSMGSGEADDGDSTGHLHDESEFFLEDENELDEEEDETLNPHETETLNALIARWVCKRYHPLGITEDPELRDIINYALTLRKRVALPSQNVVRASVESLTAKTRLEMLRQFSNEMMFFAMATEVWTTAEDEAFLSVSIHYNTDKFERRHFTLDVRAYNGPLTADAKRELLDSLLSRWNLDSRYLCSMQWQPYPTGGYPRQYGLTPSTTAVSSRNYEISLMHTQQTEGVSHSFQLILAPLLYTQCPLPADNMRAHFHDNMVNQSIGYMPIECQRGAAFLSSQVDFFRDLAKFFSGHPQAASRFSKLVAGTTSPHHQAHRLVVDSKGNWLTTLEMLKRILQKRRAIQGFFAYLETHDGALEFQQLGNIPRQPPTPVQWSTLECLIQLLQPFETVAGALAKEKYATLAMSVALLQFLKRDLEKKSDFDRVFAANSLPVSGNNSEQTGISDPTDGMVGTIRSSLESVRAYLHMQFVVHFARPCNGMMWLSQLDPRFVRMRFLSDEDRLASKTRLGDRCYLISHFLESMANQQNRGGGSSSSSSSVGSAAVSSGASISSNSSGSSYEGTNANSDSMFDSTPFLDNTSKLEDHDTSTFLRELLFDDAPEDVAPQPPQAPNQQGHDDHHHHDRGGDANSVKPVVSAAGPFASRAAAMNLSLVPLVAPNAHADMDEQEAALRRRVTDEVNVYYDHVSSSSASAVRDPMRWWKQHGAQYPLLAPLARKWLSAIGSVRPTTHEVRVMAGTSSSSSSVSSSGGSSKSSGPSGSATAGSALSAGIHDPPSPELVRDMVFIHDNC